MSGQLHAPPVLHPEKRSRYPLDTRLGGPQSLWNRNKSLSLAGNQTPAVQSLALFYTDWAIPPVPMTICSKHFSSRDSLLQISETLLIFTYECHIWLIHFNKNCNVPTKFSQYEITWSARQLLYSDRQTWRSSSVHLCNASFRTRQKQVLMRLIISKMYLWFKVLFSKTSERHTHMPHNFRLHRYKCTFMTSNLLWRACISSALFVRCSVWISNGASAILTNVS
jgi:hypothetical protein